MQPENNYDAGLAPVEPNVEKVGRTMTTNSRGEWVPAIPEPLFVGALVRRARCDCGDEFRSRRRYREHYALAHVMGLP